MKKNFLRRAWNRALHILARHLPGARTIRPFLHRLRGVKIYGKIGIGDNVYLENEYPECIEIHEGAHISLCSIVLAHTRGVGKVIIDKNVWIGVNSLIVTSHARTLTIGEGAVVGAGSLLTTSVPPYTFVGAERARPIARVTVPLNFGTSYEDFMKGLVPLSRASRTKDPDKDTAEDAFSDERKIRPI